MVDQTKTLIAIISSVTNQAEISLLEEALIVWRTRQTKIRGNVSLNSFADAIGASRSIVSMWMLGERPITEAYKLKIADGLADLVGPKAYEVLNVNPSDPDLQRLSKIWKYIPDKIRQSMLKQGEKFVTDENEDESKNPIKSHT